VQGRLRWERWLQGLRRPEEDAAEAAEGDAAEAAEGDAA